MSILSLNAAADVGYTTIAHTGETVPQTDGLQSFRFSPPVLNNAGQVATDLTYDRATFRHALTIFPTPGVYNPIAFQGNVAPGATDGATFGPSFANTTLNDIGQVTFKNYIGSDFSKDESLFTTPNPESDIAISMFLTARKGNPAPGLPDGTVYTRVGADNYMIPLPVFGEGGQVAFVSGLSGGGTTTTNAKALFVGSPGGLMPIVRQGDPTAHSGFEYLFDFGSNLNINPSGAVAFRSSLKSGANSYPNGGIFLATPQNGGTSYAVDKLATLRELPPGSSNTFIGFSNPSLNSAGDVAFVGETGAAAPNAYLLVGRPGKLITVAHTGDIIPGTGVAPNFFVDPLLSTNGAVTFAAGIASTDGARNSAMFSGLPGKIKIVAREGDPTPAGPDTFFGDFAAVVSRAGYMTNGHGQVAFSARLTGPGVTPATSQALFATDRAGQLMLVARYGQTFDTDTGPRTAGSYFTTYASNGSDGLPSSFNDLGQLVFALIADSGTAPEYSALIRAQIPFPGDANADGVVNTADFKALSKHFNQPGGQGDGDFNHDGMVSFADFQLLENWFGRSASNAPVSVSAADVAALSAFESSVPEPPILLPLLASLLMIRPRRHGLRDALLRRTRAALAS